MSPSDLLHLFQAGLKKALLSWILIIINALEKADGDRFSHARSDFDIAIMKLNALPPMEHVSENVVFSNGFFYILENKTTEGMAAGAASFGGKFRSSEFTNCLLMAYLAVSTQFFIVLSAFYLC
jgi:hypothetical protein